MHERWTAALLSMVFLMTCVVGSASAQEVLHVAPSGRAEAAGAEDAPIDFAGALARLASALQAGDLPDGGAEVIVHGGRYAFTSPFVLDECFVGTAEHPITIRAAAGEQPVFDGAVYIEPGAFGPVRDVGERARLAASAAVQVASSQDSVLAQGLVAGVTFDF